MDKCQIDECDATVSKAGHKLCYEHWKAERDGLIIACEDCRKYKDNDYPLCLDCYNKKKSGAKPSKSMNSGKQLNSTTIGKDFDISAVKVNQILAELGWITRFAKGWTVTPEGEKEGGQMKEAFPSGARYVVWPEEILQHPVLTRSIAEYKGDEFDPEDNDWPLIDDVPTEKASQTSADNFREKFPCKYRTMDGHMVRSKAEMTIDNFLYVNSLVHAFERKLPIEEDLYCDFYLPQAKVYIEYWGLEDDAKYEARKKIKIDLYQRHGYKLIELTEEHVMNLDDHLPRMLLKYGINTD